MEIMDIWKKQTEAGRPARWLRSLAGLLALTLVVGAGIMALAQEAPEPPPPPDPPDPPQTFVLNDGTPHLGVSLGDISAEKAQELKLPAIAGALVNHVQKDSPAAKAGIQVGDAILEFDGVRVRSSAELRRLIRETPSGRTVAIKLNRSGKSQVVSAKLEASNDHFRFNVPEVEVHVPPINIPEIHIGSARATLGISADDLTPQLAQYFGVKQGNGVLVSEVTQDGPADKAGLKAGDVIVQVDGKPVSDVDGLRSALNDNFTEDTRKVSLTIVRDRHEQNLSADLTRHRAREKRTSKTGFIIDPQVLAEIQQQAEQARMLADRFRTQAATQLQDELQYQKKQMQGEWQRELQEQMRTLKDQLQQMHLASRQNGEI